MNYIPNIISGFRILLIPVLVYFLLISSYSAALYIFIFMSISDFLDGAVARFFHFESLYGAYIDAIADKLMINICILILCEKSILPYYFFYIVFIRDMTIIFGVILFNDINEKIIINRVFLSKINTVLLVSLIIYSLLYLNKIASFLYIQDFINISILTSILSAVEYTYRFKKKH